MTDDEREDERSAADLERARRKRVIDEARATVRRLKREEKQRRDDASTLSPEDLARKLIPSAPEDRVAAWRKDAEARIAAREEVRAQERARADLIYKQFENKPTETRCGEEWNEWLRSALEREREFVLDVVGTCLGEMLEEHKKNDHRGDDHGAEIARLWRSFADLQKTLAELHRDRGVDRALRGTTIDAKAIN
jgi:hypothetical protein